MPVWMQNLVISLYNSWLYKKRRGGMCRMKLMKSRDFTEQDKESFLHALEARLGKAMVIRIEYVAEITRKNSGKFRIVRNILEKPQVSV